MILFVDSVPYMHQKMQDDFLENILLKNIRMPP